MEDVREDSVDWDHHQKYHNQQQTQLSINKQQIIANNQRNLVLNNQMNTSKIAGQLNKFIGRSMDNINENEILYGKQYQVCLSLSCLLFLIFVLDNCPSFYFSILTNSVRIEYVIAIIRSFYVLN